MAVSSVIDEACRLPRTTYQALLSWEITRAAGTTACFCCALLLPKL